MKILVTGNAGFMGSHLVDYLLNKGHTVCGIDNFSGGFKRNVNSKCWFYENDLLDRNVVYYIKSIQPDILYHLAADATEGRSQFTPVSATENNLMAYIHTLTGAILGGVKKVILTSSMSVYGKQKPPFDESMIRMPEDVYGVNKTSMERITEILSSVHGFSYTIVRPHNVFGERQNIRDPYRNVIGIFINRILQGKPPIIYGDGEQKRAFTYIDNFTPYFAKIMTNKRTDGEIINIGPTEVFTVNTVAYMILQLMESPLKPIYYPARPLEVKYAYCTSEKAKKLLGYKTTVLFQEGLARMIRWAKSLGEQPFKYLTSLEIPTDKTPATWLYQQM